MENFEIRRLRPDEMEDWFALRLEALRDSPTAFMASPETEITQGVNFFRSRIIEGGDNNIIFVCFDQNKMIGTAGLAREENLKARHKATLWGMYVSPPYRKQKVGRLLLKSVIAHARILNGLLKIDLSVESSRESAKSLYFSLGFTKWGSEERAIFVNGQYYDEDYYSLFL